MAKKKIDIKGIISEQLRLVLEAGTIRSLLEGLSDYALNSEREDYEPCLSFSHSKQTLETIALLAKLVVDNDTKIEVAEASAKKEENDGLDGIGIVMPNGIEISMSELKQRYRKA